MDKAFGEIRLGSVTYTQQTYQILRKAILDGKLQPGHRMVAKHLTETLGVSRTPLREAFQLLEQEGLVRRRPNGVVEVVGLSLGEIEELYEIRAMVEGMACRRAATRITSEQLTQLERVAQEIGRSTAANDYAAVERYGREFHRIIFEAGDTNRGGEILRQLQDQIHRYRPVSIAMPGRTADAFKEHAVVQRALMDRDPDAAEQAMRDHVMSGGRMVLASLRRTFGVGTQAAPKPIPIDREYLSVFNQDPAALSGLRLRPDLIINDCTLREGEQASEVNFGADEKVELARRLASAGIRLIQGGYPGRSRLDMEAIQRIKGEGLPLAVEAIAQAFTPDWKAQIDACLASGADVVDLMYPSSDVRLKYVQKATRAEMVERVREAVRYARGRGAVVRFSPTDSTRTELGFLKEVYGAALDAGAERIAIADTAGTISPAGMRYLVSKIVEFVGTHVPIQVHTHNDAGQGLANALAAAEAGAAIVDGCLYGLGERAGNTATEELAATLTFFYGLDLGIDLARLAEAARFAESLSGISIHPSKPIIGRDAFAHKLEAHVMGVMANPVVYEPFPPEAVGNRRRFPLGKYAGPWALQARLAELGLPAPGEKKLEALRARVEALAVTEKRQITDEELAKLTEEV